MTREEAEANLEAAIADYSHRRPTAPAYDPATEVDPEPAGIPAHWWALGAACSAVAAAVGHVRSRWWWPWP